MVTRTALGLRYRNSGLRPLQPMRDLSSVADLLERVFSRELDANGRRMIQEARMMGRAGPFMYLLVPLSGGGVGFSPGYVWEENGQIVGNVTMIRSSKRSGVWQIANVAVDSDYRRQGIASRMLAESVAYIRRHKGHTVGLQVRQENKAIALYLRHGFQAQGAVTRWRLSGRLSLDRILAHGRQVIRARRQDWAEIWQIFSSMSPAAQGWPEPMIEKDFRPSFWRWLSEFPAVRSVKRWVTPRVLGEGLQGYVETSTVSGMIPQLTLRVRPDFADTLEGDLLAAALSDLSKRGYYRTVTDHPTGDVPAEGRFREAGFRPQRTLMLMQLDLTEETG